MRFLVKVQWDVQAGNELARKGTLGSTVESILEEQKPEAAYFTAENGKRTGLLFMNLESASQIPAIAEPWFLSTNAAIDFVPVMLPEDLKEAGPAIVQAVARYGG
jgi:hypothetical protein